LSAALDRPIDREVYSREIAAWLPERIVDVHVHVSLPEHSGPVSAERKMLDWAMEVGIFQSWDELATSNRTLFPGKRVSSLVFGGVYREVDLDTNNAYVLRGARDPAAMSSGLYVTAPGFPEGRVRDALESGFLGIKPYPDLAPQGSLEVSIYDFLPEAHLSVLNEFGGILMLHLPRAGRLADPDNIREVNEIAERYPMVRIILPHIGRAFCLPTAERGLKLYPRSPNLLFDTSANLNADVFSYALDTLGPERVLYGSDLPITLMHGAREHVGERYVNFTDGDYSWNSNRKSPEEEATYTYFLYQQIRAMIAACEMTGLGKPGMEMMMYENGARLLGLGEDS
jgi:uncharacterized protein